MNRFSSLDAAVLAVDWLLAELVRLNPEIKKDYRRVARLDEYGHVFNPDPRHEPAPAERFASVDDAAFAIARLARDLIRLNPEARPQIEAVAQGGAVPAPPKPKAQSSKPKAQNPSPPKRWTPGQ